MDPAPRNDYSAEAKALLRSLAEEGSPPKVLEVLRALRSELLKVHSERISATKIWRTLAKVPGYQFPRSTFYQAWNIFLAENGFVKRGSHLARPLDALARVGANGGDARAVRRVAASVHPNSAMVKVHRMSVSDLLASKNC